ncbi:voltage-dependent anion channel-domain-containing protein [Xylariaceae sp. FL0804]|nr:voltage-dependent anion channel-domain-containing protein [Xylariaceae sp. FL0804]
MSRALSNTNDNTRTHTHAHTHGHGHLVVDPGDEVAQNGYMTPGEDHFRRSGGASSPAMTMMMKSSSSPAHDAEKHAGNPFSDSLAASRRFHRDQPPNPESLARMISNARKDKHARGEKIGLRDRICCFQWTWFTMTMATGGVSNVLYSLSSAYSADWIWYIGLVFFLFNVCLFLTNTVLISMRFAMVPGSFMHSFLDQMESLFIPAVVVSIATIFINICEYGVEHTGPWLRHTMEWLFWIYIIVSVSASAGMYLILWSTQIFPIHTMTPVWVFPGYPLLLTAPFAANLIQSDTNSDPQIRRLDIAIAAVTVQGTGFLISFMICAAFIYRLMTQKLPQDMQRPGVFISIGPAGFTVGGLVLLGQQAKAIIPADAYGQPHTVYILELLSLLLGLWLWGLSLWFFLVSVGSLWKFMRWPGPGHRHKRHKMPFQMTWWSFVFPNTALVTATLALSEAMDSAGLRVFGSVMATALVVVWTLVFATMLRCLGRRQLLWPKELESE